MKSLNETFTDAEFDSLRKLKGDMNWHDWILKVANRVTLEDEMGKHIEVTGVRKK